MRAGVTRCPQVVEGHTLSSLGAAGRTWAGHTRCCSRVTQVVAGGTQVGPRWYQVFESHFSHQ